jgi:hypothetical protein
VAIMVGSDSWSAVAGEIQSCSVEAVEQVELRAGLVQFVAVKVAGHIAFSVVEAARTARCGDDLLEPEPRDDDVPEGLEIERAIGQRGIGFI